MAIRALHIFSNGALLSIRNNATWFLIAVLVFNWALLYYLHQSCVATNPRYLFHYYINHQFQESNVDIDSDIAYAETFLPGLKRVLSQVAGKHTDVKAQFRSNLAARRQLLQETWFQLEVQDAYIPQLLCLDDVRLGPIGDGGYVLCNPWALAQSTEPCVMYSLGMLEMVEFEYDFYNITGQRCTIFCFDSNDERKDIYEPFHGTFMQAAINDKTDVARKRYSLLDLTHKFGHKKLDVLKVDIEGAEFNALPTFLRQFNSTICHLLLEVHANVNSDVHLWVRMFKMLERRGYFMFYRESNTRDDRCYQYSYLHNSCFQQYGVSMDDVLFTYFI